MTIQLHVEPASVQSIYLEAHTAASMLASGTGILVRRAEEVFVITNRHMVTGLHQDTNHTIWPSQATPDRMVFALPESETIGVWTSWVVPLIDDNGNKVWFEHPTLGSKADVVALRLTNPPPHLVNYAYDLGVPPPNVRLRPGEILNVVGFPFGIASAGRLALWSTGFVASELWVHIDRLPIFLIDCRTRPGQSGSAVIYNRTGIIPMANGDIKMATNTVFFLLGLYSGRIANDSDLGRVWRTSALVELMSAIPWPD